MGCESAFVVEGTPADKKMEVRVGLYSMIKASTEQEAAMKMHAMKQHDIAFKYRYGPFIILEAVLIE